MTEAPPPDAPELAGRRVLLGLTGGIACYKAAELCRLLVKAGAQVRVAMTEAACRFITPLTMQALSGQPVFVSQWDARPNNHMAHIELGREAERRFHRANRAGARGRAARAALLGTT